MELIERNRLLMHLSDWWLTESPREIDPPAEVEKQKIICDTIARAERAVKQQPVIDPERHGRWLMPESEFGRFWRCSECGERNMYRKFNYCPWCGARME